MILKADGALGGNELDVHVADAYDVQDILYRARPLEFGKRCWVLGVVVRSSGQRELF